MISIGEMNTDGPAPHGSCMLLPYVSTWGARTLVWSDPIVEVHQDVLYVPAGDGWGLFASDGALIQAGEYRRWSGSTPVGQHQRTDMDRAAVPFAEGEDWIYTGPMIAHYGHFLTASLSRLWFLGLADGPRGRLLCHDLSGGGPAYWATLPHMASVFGALGLNAFSFAALDRPVRLRRVTIPRPCMEEQNFIHRRLGAFCRAIGGAVTAGQSLVRNDRPAYLSKSRLKTGIHHFTNEAEVEERLAAAGVEIVHPQEMTFTAQAALFAERAVILGGLGSAFHTAIFAREGGRAVCLSPGSTINSNYLLLDQVCERAFTYVHLAEGAPTGEALGFQSAHILANARDAADGLLRLAGL